MSLRPRRSVLYMPASNQKAIDKARTLPCDAVILDLEDAVAPDAKDLAREQAVAAVKAGGFGRREVIIRANGLDTPWGEADLAAAAAAGPDAVLVPKVNDAGDVARYDARLDHAPAHTKLWAMIETGRVLFHLESTAAAARTSRMSAWVMGTNDLVKETGARLTTRRDALWAPLSLSVAAAKAHGLVILDGVFNGLEDAEGFEQQCLQGLEFGFDGKTLIHPNQVETANRVFAPTEAEVAFAKAVIAAFALPENANKGAIRVEGKMAERLHLAQAEKTVAVAEAIAAG
jgi:citrate lyase subunit beta/citryl-CoA lyase